MKFTATFVTFLAIWVLLTGFVVQELIVGVFVSLALAIILVKFTNYEMSLQSPIKLLKFIVIYIPVFSWQLLLSNIDLAKRVLSPVIPLNPGIVKIDTDLKGDMGKLALANSITLTPGTLTMDVDDGLYIHCVDVVGENRVERKKNVSAQFENILKGIFK